MDLNEFRKNKAPLIVKVTDVIENYSPERPGFHKVECELDNGDKTFICLSQKEIDDLPYKEGYANMTSVARISTWSKNGRSGKYLERLVPLPSLKKSASAGWVNPWAVDTKAKKP